MNQTSHYHMISGEIVFRTKGDEQINAMRMNGILKDQERDIPVRLLGKAQQVLQLNFHQRMQDQNLEVIDVVLMNFMYLGLFTEEEFHRAPEGTKLQEVPKEAPAPVDLDAAVAEATQLN